MKKTLLTSFSGWKKYVLLYLGLLLISHLVVWMFGESMEQEPETKKSASLNIVREDSIVSDKTVDIYYQDIYTGKEKNPVVLLLLPGGFEGPAVYNNLIQELSSEYRLIVPHLPDDGKHWENLPNYSFSTLADYSYQLMQKLDISEANIVGYGLGGASAIYLAHNYSNKVKSLSLISSIGVQELELLGSYRLNHAVHGIQLGAVWMLNNIVPHFGILNWVGIDVSYAKSHYESDQRPLRSHLKQYQKPMLILHGEEDPLVPIATAKEHYRIVPQSRLAVFNADHDLVETHSDSVSQSIKKFISDVEAGQATTASNASTERIQQAQESFSNVEFQRFKGVSLLILMLIIMLSTLISEDLTGIGAGLLVARGMIGFWPAAVACLMGIMVGDIGLYLVGRYLGRPALRKAPFKWIISESDLTRSAKWFHTRGPAIITISRFLPGSRLPIYFSAGVIGAGFWMFLGYFLLSAVVWTPMMVGIGKILGNELLRYFSLYQNYAIWVFIGAIIFLVVFIKVILPVFSYRGRRFLISRWRRLTRWEYWSPVIIYMPVIFYVVYLGIKYRNLTLFTAANPALKGYSTSKYQTLSIFDAKLTASTAKISADTEESKIEEAKKFIAYHNLAFPIVLKPDNGKQGTKVIYSNKQLEEYFSDNASVKKDIIIQEYIGGKEYSLFYYRKPGTTTGDIFSITTKEPLYVEGDGNKTLEQLILDDNQAVSLAKYHLKQNEDRLYQVPLEGEQIPIAGVNTKARPDVFEDGSQLITNELLNYLDETCKSVDGFYFGQFEIIAPSKENLRQAEGLKIIEISGVTSIPTHIYDSQYSFLEAQRILRKQWKLAFKIGYQNQKEGTEVVPILTFLKRMVRYAT